MSKPIQVTVKELKETISDTDDNARVFFSFDDEDEHFLMELVSVSKNVTLTWNETDSLGQENDEKTILRFSFKKRLKKGGN